MFRVRRLKYTFLKSTGFRLHAAAALMKYKMLASYIIVYKKTEKEERKRKEDAYAIDVRELEAGKKSMEDDVVEVRAGSGQDVWMTCGLF